MKFSWIFVILLLLFVTVFSVQNAEPVTVHFRPWEIQMSAALVIQLSAILGALVGLIFGAWSGRATRRAEREKVVEHPVEKPVPALPAERERAPYSSGEPVGPPLPPGPERKHEGP